MEKGESILEAIYEEEDLGDGEDVEMLDVEEGELVDGNSVNDREKSGVSDVDGGNQGSQSKNKKRRANKRKNKKKEGGSGPKPLDINSSQVDAIQSCGGQLTADGRRYRTGGGILWNIIKAREPAAYREIMKKARDFEKQFKQQNTGRVPAKNKASSPQETASNLINGTSASVLEDSQLLLQNPQEQFSAEGTWKSVHDRIRVPVSYEDLQGEDPKDE